MTLGDSNGESEAARPSSAERITTRQGFFNSPQHDHGAVRPLVRYASAALALGVVALLFAACGGSPPKPHAAAATYPLNIPVAKRSPAQKAEGRLMLYPFLSTRHMIPPLPPDLVGKVKHPSTVAEVRLSMGEPNIATTTGSSFGPTVVAVYSTAITGNTYQLAMLGGKECLEEKLTKNSVQFGETSFAHETHLVQVNGCTATLTPGSGWLAAWPPSSDVFPPKTPIHVRVVVPPKELAP